MKRRIVVYPRADLDLDEQAAYIAQDSLDAATRFLDATRETFEQLATMPEVGAIQDFHSPSLAGVRVWQVRGFPNHLVFYRPTESDVEILRVLHGARDLPAVFEQE